MAKYSCKPQKLRLIIGIVLIFAGVLLSFLLIKHQYDDCAYRWHNNLDGFGFKYASAWDCFITRSTGAIVIAGIAGIALFAIGWYLILRKPKVTNN